jgi:hypothetical protein
VHSNNTRSAGPRPPRKHAVWQRVTQARPDEIARRYGCRPKHANVHMHEQHNMEQASSLESELEVLLAQRSLRLIRPLPATTGITCTPATSWNRTFQFRGLTVICCRKLARILTSTTRHSRRGRFRNRPMQRTHWQRLSW